MSAIDDIIEKIIEETYIIKGAVDSGDLDVANVALDRRDSLILILQKVEMVDKQEKVKQIYPLISKIDDECKLKIKELKSKTEKDFYSNRSQQHKLVTNRKAHDRYNNNALSEFGSRFDDKK